MDFNKFIQDLEKLVVAADNTITNAKETFEAAVDLLNDSKDYFAGLFGKKTATTAIDPKEYCRALCDEHKKKGAVQVSVSAIDWKTIWAFIKSLIDSIIGA